jgi:hypothetical protein
MKKSAGTQKNARQNKALDLRDPKYFINRELSWMQFD